MDWATRIVALLVWMWTVVYSICPPDACVGVQCPAVQCGSAERYDKQGGVCGCCPACVPDVRIGTYAENIFKKF